MVTDEAMTGVSVSVRNLLLYKGTTCTSVHNPTSTTGLWISNNKLFKI